MGFWRRLSRTFSSRLGGDLIILRGKVTPPLHGRARRNTLSRKCCALLQQGGAPPPGMFYGPYGTLHWADRDPADDCRGRRLVRGHLVRCGGCPWCEALNAVLEHRKRRDLCAALALEVSAAPVSWMATLTFRVEDTDYRIWQLFMKRLRKDVGHPVRFYCAAERGTREGRYHYHALLFGTPRLVKRRIETAWTQGYSQVRRVRSEGAARYVSKYITKDGARLPARASNHLGWSSPVFLAWAEIWGETQRTSWNAAPDHVR